MDAPETNVRVDCNTSSKISTARSEHYWVLGPARDDGVIVTDPGGYYINMSLSGMQALIKAMQQWVEFQAWKFRPTGWKLTSIGTGEERVVESAMSVALIGDSFYLRDAKGEQIGEALPAATWRLSPIIPAPTA